VGPPPSVGRDVRRRAAWESARRRSATHPCSLPHRRQTSQPRAPRHGSAVPRDADVRAALREHPGRFASQGSIRVLAPRAASVRSAASAPRRPVPPAPRDQHEMRRPAGCQPLRAFEAESLHAADHQIGPIGIRLPGFRRDLSAATGWADYQLGRCGSMPEGFGRLSPPPPPRRRYAAAAAGCRRLVGRRCRPAARRRGPASPAAVHRHLRRSRRRCAEEERSGARRFSTKSRLPSSMKRPKGATRPRLRSIASPAREFSTTSTPAGQAARSRSAKPGSRLSSTRSAPAMRRKARFFLAAGSGRSQRAGGLSNLYRREADRRRRRHGSARVRRGGCGPASQAHKTR
jgi:hypothetical protein